MNKFVLVVNAFLSAGNSLCKSLKTSFRSAGKLVC